jgi:hypothetical protein
VVLAFAGLTATVAQAVYRTGGPNARPANLGQSATGAPPSFVQSDDAAEVKRCTVPAFAKAMGHEDKWRLHNNCQ